MSTFLIENYGCQMNVSEAESLRELLENHGYTETKDPAIADIVIINTCSVRLTAEDRVIGRLGFYRGLRETTMQERYVILMGCMAQNRGEEVKTMFPDIVKRVWGTYHKDRILEDLRLLERGRDFLDLSDYHFPEAVPQATSPFRAYLPISHGCDNFCSYCIVPLVRGSEISRRFDEIMEQARHLLDRGVKEIVLLGQNVNSYTDGTKHFEDVLETLASRLSVPRIRFLTSHPRDFRKSMVDVIGSFQNISRLVHLPAQSGNNRILSLMNRGYTREDYLERVEWLRSVSDLEISTDLMVGFPSETNAEYEDTLALMRAARYIEVFSYYYNIRPKTKAATMEDALPEETKLARLDTLIKLHRSLRQKQLETWIGRTDEVLIENPSKRDASVFFAVSRSGVPAYVKGDSLSAGDLLQVKFTGLKGSGVSAVPSTHP